MPLRTLLPIPSSVLAQAEQDSSCSLLFLCLLPPSTEALFSHEVLCYLRLALSFWTTLGRYACCLKGFPVVRLTHGHTHSLISLEFGTYMAATCLILRVLLEISKGRDPTYWEMIFLTCSTNGTGEPIRWMGLLIPWIRWVLAISTWVLPWNSLLTWSWASGSLC